jgi:hypothetical protein
MFGMNEGNSFKAKITTTLGTFEFEGSEEFVEKQIGKVIQLEETASHSRSSGGSDGKQKPAGKSAGNANPTKRSAGEQPKMLPNLISGKEKLDSLRQFYDAKHPTNHMEIFAVLTYWLKSDLKMADVSIDEMWTLYKVLQIRPPKVLIQTFRDGKSKKAFFDVLTSNGRYFLTSYGETFVEHDLPKQIEEKKG